MLPRSLQNCKSNASSLLSLVNLSSFTVFNRYASEVDIDFVRKAVRSIGRLAIKVEAAADQCIQTLLNLLEMKVTYVVQEATIVIKDIFRRYPGQYEGIIPKLCEHMDALDESESKAAIVWILGQFANRIDNADELLDDLCYTFLEESVEVRSFIHHERLPSYLTLVHGNRSSWHFSQRLLNSLYTNRLLIGPKNSYTRF